MLQNHFSYCCFDLTKQTYLFSKQWQILYREWKGSWDGEDRRQFLICNSFRMKKGLIYQKFDHSSPGSASERLFHIKVWAFKSLFRIGASGPSSSSLRRVRSACIFWWWLEPCACSRRTRVGARSSSSSWPSSWRWAWSDRHIPSVCDRNAACLERLERLCPPCTASPCEAGGGEGGGWAHVR